MPARRVFRCPWLTGAGAIPRLRQRQALGWTNCENGISLPYAFSLLFSAGILPRFYLAPQMKLRLGSNKCEVLEPFLRDLKGVGPGTSAIISGQSNFQRMLRSRNAN